MAQAGYVRLPACVCHRPAVAGANRTQTQRKKVVPNREERITDRLTMSKHGRGSGNY